MTGKELVAQYIRCVAAEHNAKCDLQFKLNHVLEVMEHGNRNHEFLDSFSVYNWCVGYNEISLTLVHKQDGECFVQLKIPVAMLDATEPEILEFARQLDWAEAIKMDAESTEKARKLLESQRKMYESLKKKFEV